MRNLILIILVFIFTSLNNKILLCQEYNIDYEGSYCKEFGKIFKSSNELKKFDFENNSDIESIIFEDFFLDSIPESIYNLKKLNSIFINGAFGDKLSEFLINIKYKDKIESLKIIDTKINNLDSIFILFTNLKCLKLENVNISKNIESITKLKELLFLEISKCPVFFIPSEIRNLKNLKVLFLKDIQLIYLPIEINELIHLSSLFLKNTQLFDFPDISNLTELKIFESCGNSFDEIKLNFTNLKKLEIIMIDGNNNINLNEFIDSIYSIKDQIKYFSFLNENIREIPEKLYNFENLEGLNLGLNKITEIDDNIQNLTKLKELYIDGNYLITLPDSIINLKSLEYLSVKDNNIKSISRSIKNFCLVLKSFQIDNNPINFKKIGK
jgi:leucine-rich repeat protein SHOC2